MDKPKLLILSVSPKISSGYGQISARLIRVFKELNIDISFLAYYGARYTDEFEGVKIKPTWGNMYGEDSVLAEIKINKPDILLTTFDIFILKPEFFKKVKAQGINIASLLMVDSAPFQCQNYPTLQEVDYPIVVTEQAKQQIPKEIADKAIYIPLGLDEAYYPIDKKQARIGFNEIMGFDLIKEDTKLVSVVSANCGDDMGRKNYFGIVEGWRQYLDSAGTDNKYIYLHTDIRGVTSGGIDIKQMMVCQKYTGKQASTIIFPNQLDYFSNAFKPEFLNCIYNSSDIYLNPSQGEGFGLPICESIAAGCSPLVTNFGASMEIILNTQIDATKHLLEGTPIYVGGNARRCNVQPEEIAVKISTLIDNQVSLANRLASSKLAIEEYGHDKQVKLWREFFKGVI